MTWTHRPGSERRKPRQTMYQQHCRYCGRLYSQTNSEKMLLGFCSVTCYQNNSNAFLVQPQVSPTL